MITANENTMKDFMSFIMENTKLDNLNNKGGELFQIVFLNSVREANTIDFMNNWTSIINDINFNDSKTPYLIKGLVAPNQIDMEKTKSETEISLKEKPTRITIRAIKKEDKNEKF